ncbi:MAG: hypothetical protein R2882_13890 [Gemmatimonadales bacterium]
MLRPLAVTVDGDIFAATADSLLVLVTPGTAPSPAVVDYRLASGRLALTVTGVPAGQTAQITIDGPGGYSAAATATTVFKGLLPGTYLLSGPDLDLDGDLFGPTFSASPVVIAATEVAVPVSAEYRIKTGSLALAVGGLPGGTAAAVTVTGPGGFNRLVTATDTLRGLVPGGYQIAAANVSAGGGVYLGTPGSQNVSIVAATTPAPASVTYSVGVGTLDLTVAGLPGGLPAAVSVTGPGGYANTVTASTTLAGLVPGVYTVAAGPVSTTGQVYAGAPLSQTLTVVLNDATPGTVTYSPTRGALDVVVAGLPGGVSAAVTVTGPGGFTETVTASTTLTGLVAGSYAVAAAAVSAGGQTYNPAPSNQTATVTVGATAMASVLYAGTLGGLVVSVSGLPGGAAAAVSVTGPAGYSHTVTATESLTGLAAGTYPITAAGVTSGGYLYQPTPTSQTATVSAGSTVSKAVSYAATGKLTVTVTGLPGGASAAITVTGPGGYNQSVTATTTLADLTPGTYTVTAATVSSGGTSYTASPGSQTAAVTGAATAAKSVAYTAANGALTVTISGLPGGALAAVTVTGPGGYGSQVTATTTLTGLSRAATRSRRVRSCRAAPISRPPPRRPPP